MASFNVYAVISGEQVGQELSQDPEFLAEALNELSKLLEEPYERFASDLAENVDPDMPDWLRMLAGKIEEARHG